MVRMLLLLLLLLLPNDGSLLFLGLISLQFCMNDNAH